MRANGMRPSAIRPADLAPPEIVAHLAVWLASDDARFATSQFYTLYGGLTAGSIQGSTNTEDLIGSAAVVDDDDLIEGALRMLPNRG